MTLVVTPISIVLAALYWRGIRGIWLFVGLIAVCCAIVAIASVRIRSLVCGSATCSEFEWADALLEFEVKPPEGQSVESLASVEPELDTDRNSMPGYWHTDSTETAGVRSGYVEVYYRTSRRLFVLKFPGHEDRIFQLHLPANPMKAKYRAWSDWQKPDYIAKDGEQPPGHPAEATIKFAISWTIRIDNVSAQRFTSRQAAA